MKVRFIIFVPPEVTLRWRGKPIQNLRQELDWVVPERAASVTFHGLECKVTDTHHYPGSFIAVELKPIMDGTSKEAMITKLTQMAASQIWAVT